MSEAENAVAEEAAGESDPVSDLGDLYDKLQAEPGDEVTSHQDDDTSAEKSQSERDEKGRFKAKEQDESAQGATEEDTDQGETQEGETETSIEPPASWSADWKAKWPSFDRATQEYILGREREAHEAIEQRATKLKGYEPFDAALAPVRQELELQGVQPAQFVSQLVAAHRFLKEQPQQAIPWLAQQYGIDLSQLNQQAESVDPAIAPVLNEVNQVKAQIQQFKDEQQRAEQARLQAELDAFSKDKPHFEEVRADMAALINAGRANDLQTAYDMAIWANPSTRTKLQAEQSAEAEAKRKKEADERAKNAARISKTNLSSKGTAGGATPPQYKNRVDELESIYDQVTGAA